MLLLYLLALSTIIGATIIELVESFGEIVNRSNHNLMKDRLQNIADRIWANISTYNRVWEELGLEDFMSGLYDNYTESLPIFVKVIRWRIMRARFGKIYT